MFPRDYFPSSLTPFNVENNALVYTGTNGTKYLVETYPHPANIPGLQLWLKADTITDVVDGASVTTWSDSSGQSRDASAPSTGAQPTFQAIARHGHPAVVFNGTNQFLDGPAANWQTFFAVAWCDTSPTQHMSLWGAAPSNMDMSVRRFSYGPNYCHGNANDFATVANYWINGTATNQVTNGVWHIVSCQSPTIRNFAYCVGGTGLWPSRLWKGKIAEILIYDSALSVLDMQQVERYLATKYGLPASNG